MKLPKSQSPVNLKVILTCSFTVLLLILILRSTSSSSSSSSTSSDNVSAAQEISLGSTQCTKIPPSLSEALVHYATSNITPQQTIQEISVSLKVLQKKSPCNFLVFGLGYDSLLWTSLNHGGLTVFLEEDKSWIQQIQTKFPSLTSHHVIYDTVLTQADDLLSASLSDKECTTITNPRDSKCRLALKGLPKEVYEVEWDLIMVDAPTGYHDGAPGRMSAVYTAGLMARNREAGETDVFVHDVNRVVEDKFSKGFLCEGYLTQQEGRLRHFTIPSHRTRSRPFCP